MGAVGWLLGLYAAGALVGLIAVDGTAATKVALAVTWPVGIVAFVVTILILVAVAAVAFPVFGAIVVAAAAAAWLWL